MQHAILFLNACVRHDSRTKWLADRLLRRLDRPVTELCLHKLAFPVVDEAYLNLRDRLIRERDFANPLFDLARQFSQAEEIVIAAPYWDLSVPAALKQYLELINVTGITFQYTPEGIPVGLCRAKRLFFVTTAGGCFAPEEYGFGYVKALAQNYYGIPDVRQIKAVGLDLVGADVDAILRRAEAEIMTLSPD